MTFQHTAARRRLTPTYRLTFSYPEVSTHSRPKAAEWSRNPRRCLNLLFQHTAARRRLSKTLMAVSDLAKFQHTAARRRLIWSDFWVWLGFLFQHTAARRRLIGSSVGQQLSNRVSTHSRPKAAENLGRNATIS